MTLGDQYAALERLRAEKQAKDRKNLIVFSVAYVTLMSVGWLGLEVMRLTF